MSSPAGADDPTVAAPFAPPTRVETPADTAATRVSSSPSAPPPSAPSNELSGRFGRYEIVRLLGRGGMGAVYLAKQTDLDRLVVVKVIIAADEEGAVERFQREARAAARVSSDRVVQVHETGVERGIPYIAMEYVDGSSAADLLKAKGKLDWTQATQLVAAAAEGLAVAHRTGILHRDLKPANILVGKDGRVKVADFGLAKFTGTGSSANAALTAAGMIVGTPHYMSPEQAEGQTLDARADIYSLGVTYFELLTGRRPFEGETSIRTLGLVLSGPTPSVRDHVPELPAAVDRACSKLMARDKEKRPRTADDVLALLGRISGLSPSGRAPALVIQAGLPQRPLAPPGPARSSGSVATRPGERASSVPLVVTVVVSAAVLALVAIGLARSKNGPHAATPTVATPESPLPPREGSLPDPTPAATSEPIAPTSALASLTVSPDEAELRCRSCLTALGAGDVATAERVASETLARVARDDRDHMGKLTMFRGWCRVLLDREGEGERDLARAREIFVQEGERGITPVLMSYCGALVAEDATLATSREKELRELTEKPFPGLWNSLPGLRRAAAGNARPNDRSPRFRSEVWTVVYLGAFDKLAQRARSR